MPNYLDYKSPLITALPDWQSGITMSFKTSTVISEGLTGREIRWANYQRPLISLNFTAINLENQVSGYFRNTFESRHERPVAMPVWADAAYLAETAAQGATTLACEARNRLFPWFRWAMIWSGPFIYEVVTLTALNVGSVTLQTGLKREYLAGSLIVPIAYGHMSIPESVYLTPDISEIPVEFNEVPGIGTAAFNASGINKSGLSTLGEYQLWLTSQAGASATQDFTIFSQRPDWGDSPTKGAVDDLFFEPIAGGVPAPHQAYSINRRTLAFSYTVDRYELQSILRHLEYHDGARGSFWVPTWIHDFNLREDAATGATQLVIEPSGLSRMPLRYGDFFALQGGELKLLHSSAFVRDGCIDKINLTTALTAPLAKGTHLCGAIRARLRDDELSVNCSHPASLYNLEAEFIETPDALEVSNTHKIAYLYRIRKGNYTSLWANWQFALSAVTTVYGVEQSYLWRASDIVHGEVEHSEDMLGEELEITLNGVVREYIMASQPDAEPVEIEVYKVDVSSYDPSNPPAAESIFSGVVVESEIGMRGESRLKISSQLRIFQRALAQTKLHRQCNHILFSPSCGLSRIAHTFAAEILSITGRNASVSVADHDEENDKFFTGSVLVKGGEKYVILSDKKDGGIREMVLDKPAATGACEVSLWCDKTITTCGTKFNNTRNFGGCPWLPNNNPLELARNEEGGKK